MPAGLSWPRYLAFLTVSMGSMLAGASLVHNYYKPSLVSRSCSSLVLLLLLLFCSDHALNHYVEKEILPLSHKKSKYKKHKYDAQTVYIPPGNNMIIWKVEMYNITNITTNNH